LVVIGAILFNYVWWATLLPKHATDNPDCA
jgi:hypothetical protein